MFHRSLNMQESKSVWPWERSMIWDELYVGISKGSRLRFCTCNGITYKFWWKTWLHIGHWLTKHLFRLFSTHHWPNAHKASLAIKKYLNLTQKTARVPEVKLEGMFNALKCTARVMWLASFEWMTKCRASRLPEHVPALCHSPPSSSIYTQPASKKARSH